jgi:predicted HTH domain antitoxin
MDVHVPRAALESLALEGYRAGALTQAQVRRLLGLTSLAETDGFLKQHGVYLEYDAEALEHDIANSRLGAVREVAISRPRAKLD